MIKLDYLTLGFMISLLSMLSAFVMIVMWRINPHEKKSIGMWAIAATTGAVSQSMILFYPLLGRVTVFLSLFGSLLVQFFLLEGILRFRKYGKESLRVKTFPFAVLLAMIISFAGLKDSTLRYLTHDFFIVIMLLTSTFFLMKNTKGTERSIYRITAAAFIMMATAFTGRWYLAFSGGFKDGSAEFFKGILYMTIILWVLGWTYGLMIAVNYRAQERIMKMASRDELTGLANRKNFQEVLNKMMHKSNLSNQKFILFMLDLNGFKNINDTYGHIFGDKILIMMSNAINESIRENDYAARLVGDEFVIVVKSKSDQESIEHIKERIRGSIETVRPVDGKTVQLRTAIGHSVYPEDGLGLDDIVDFADSRMYEEKVEGRPVSTVTE